MSYIENPFHINQKIVCIAEDFITELKTNPSTEEVIGENLIGILKKMRY